MRGHLVLDVPCIAAGIALWPHYGAVPIAIMGACSVAIHSWAVVDPRSSFYMRVHWRLPKTCQQLALSFDDGPHPEATPAILDVLAEHNMTATFFCIGRNVERHPDLVRRIHKAGHALGLHSHSHARTFNCWGPGRVRRDLEANAQALANATGAAAPQLWRPPVGLKNPIVAFVSQRMQLRPVTWTARALDTGARSTVDGGLARLRKGIRPRSILVLHDGHEPNRPRDTGVSVAITRQLLADLAAAQLPSHALCVRDRGIGVLAPAVSTE